MDKPAVIEGCYVDLKFMPGIKCARVSIDIPIEHSNAFLKMFDAPDRANPVPVAVARLATSTAEQSSSGLSRSTENGPGKSALAEPGVAIAEAQGQDKPRTYSRSQIAAMKCQDGDFQRWIIDPEEYGYLWKSDADAKQWDVCADFWLKEKLGIKSKTELDTSPEKAEAFDRMLTSFDHRNQVRV